MYRIDVRGLTYMYPDSQLPSLRDVSLRVEPGQWVLLQGDTGCGKSTLLRTITGACPAFYGGTITGSVQILDMPVESFSPRDRAKYIGFIGQDPESQTVYSTVGHEVAFALENLGVSRTEMKWRVAEALEVVGLAERANDSVQTLSGGQRQRLALASALVHQPGILVFDEPTSQLDPVSSEEWFDTVRRVHEEFGFTVIMSEHRVDRAYQLVDRVVYLESGRVLFDESPKQVAAWLREKYPHAIPTVARIRVSGDPCLSVREVRRALATTAADGVNEHIQRDTPQNNSFGNMTRDVPTEFMIAGKNVAFRYEGSSRAVLDECTFQVPKGGITALIGANGAGKSTLLRAIAGIVPAQKGTWTGEIMQGLRQKSPQIGDERIGYLPQNPTEYLSQSTVEKEIEFALSLRGVTGSELQRRTNEVLDRFDLVTVRARHPRDLSGGERLRVSVASTVAANPILLLLDEPTRGFDALQKMRLGKWLKETSATSIVATHDMEFVAEYADHVIFMQLGQVVQFGTARHVFEQALYFAPSVARSLRGIDGRVLCLRDAIQLGWAI